MWYKFNLAQFSFSQRTSFTNHLNNNSNSNVFAVYSNFVTITFETVFSHLSLFLSDVCISAVSQNLSLVASHHIETIAYENDFCVLRYDPSSYF